MYLLLAFSLVTSSIGGRASLPATSTAQQNYCTLCHSDVKVEFLRSVHAREGITCMSCHGGNPLADTKAQAHAGPFQGLRNRKEIPIACASCHADSSKMKPYGLPTDQLALYQTSVHGKRLQTGDVRVAVCTDCHGVHQILGPVDPESLTHPRNISKTCGRCHADQTLMASYELPASVVSDYEGSIHGKALEARNRQAPVCTSCHGTHGASPPGVGDVSIVCGHCHLSERNHFRQSPHRDAMAEAGIPECAGCHSNHQIQNATHAFWTSTCKECHETNSVEVRRGETIRRLLESAGEEIRKADGAIQEATRIPLDVSDYQARLEEARTYVVQVLPVSHGLQLTEIEDLSRRARSVAEEIQTELKQKQDLFRSRRIVLVVIWFYLLLTIAVIYRYRKELEARSRDG